MLLGTTAEDASGFDGASMERRRSRPSRRGSSCNTETASGDQQGRLSRRHHGPRITAVLQHSALRSATAETPPSAGGSGTGKAPEVVAAQQTVASDVVPGALVSPLPSLEGFEVLNVHALKPALEMPPAGSLRAVHSRRVADLALLSAAPIHASTPRALALDAEGATASGPLCFTPIVYGSPRRVATVPDGAPISAMWVTGEIGFLGSGPSSRPNTNSNAWLHGPRLEAPVEVPAPQRRPPPSLPPPLASLLRKGTPREVQLLGPQVTVWPLRSDAPASASPSSLPHAAGHLGTPTAAAHAPAPTDHAPRPPPSEATQPPLRLRMRCPDVIAHRRHGSTEPWGSCSAAGGAAASSGCNIRSEGLVSQLMAWTRNGTVSLWQLDDSADGTTTATLLLPAPDVSRVPPPAAKQAPPSAASASSLTLTAAPAAQLVQLAWRHGHTLGPACPLLVLPPGDDMEVVAAELAGLALRYAPHAGVQPGHGAVRRCFLSALGAWLEAMYLASLGAGGSGAAAGERLNVPDVASAWHAVYGSRGSGGGGLSRVSEDAVGSEQPAGAGSVERCGFGGGGGGRETGRRLGRPRRSATSLGAAGANCGAGGSAADSAPGSQVASTGSFSAAGSWLSVGPAGRRVDAGSVGCSWESMGEARAGSAAHELMAAGGGLLSHAVACGAVATARLIMGMLLTHGSRTQPLAHARNARSAGGSDGSRFGNAAGAGRAVAATAHPSGGVASVAAPDELGHDTDADAGVSPVAQALEAWELCRASSEAGATLLHLAVRSRCLPMVRLVAVEWPRELGLLPQLLTHPDRRGRSPAAYLPPPPALGSNPAVGVADRNADAGAFRLEAAPLLLALGVSVGCDEASGEAIEQGTAVLPALPSWWWALSASQERRHHGHGGGGGDGLFELMRGVGALGPARQQHSSAAAGRAWAGWHSAAAQTPGVAAAAEGRRAGDTGGQGSGAEGVLPSGAQQLRSRRHGGELTRAPPSSTMAAATVDTAIPEPIEAARARAIRAVARAAAGGVPLPSEAPAAPRGVEQRVQRDIRWRLWAALQLLLGCTQALVLLLFALLRARSPPAGASPSGPPSAQLIMLPSLCVATSSALAAAVGLLIAARRPAGRPWLLAAGITTAGRSAALVASHAAAAAAQLRSAAPGGGPQALRGAWSALWGPEGTSVLEAFVRVLVMALAPALLDRVPLARRAVLLGAEQCAPLAFLLLCRGPLAALAALPSAAANLLVGLAATRRMELLELRAPRANAAGARPGAPRRGRRSGT